MLSEPPPGPGDERGEPGPVVAAVVGGDAVGTGGSCRRTDRPRARVRYDSPMISSFSSMSIRCAAGSAPSPGIVRMSPQIG